MATGDLIAPEPFRLEVPDTVLRDLAARLALARFPETEPDGPPWRYGVPREYLRDVVDYWQTGYDWRTWEARLNRFPQYRVPIGGGRVHFVLECGSGERPFPLVLTHGWPGSFAEFIDVIEPLAHPERFGGDVADAFTVVVPSLPGYGWSDAPPAPIHPREVAERWRVLMADVLGFRRYGAQGGDWGSAVTSWLALDPPPELAAIHLNMVSLRPVIDDTTPPLDEAERRWLAQSKARREGELGYQQIQGTKPQTLAYGLTDSPIGLAAWILEKFHGWTIQGRDAPPPFDPNHLLTNVMLYWLTGINAANWMYCSTVAGTSGALGRGERVEVPTGVMLFTDDLAVPPPSRWIERAYNLVHRTDAATGGHFAAMQCGGALVEDIRAFFRPYR